MTIEVALAGGRRVCFRLSQTEKERSVTVINVLAETETVDSRGPVVTIRVSRSTPVSNTRHLSSTRTGGILITIIWIIYCTKIYYFFDLVDESWSKLKCWIKPGRKWDSPVCLLKSILASAWLIDAHLSQHPRLRLAPFSWNIKQAEVAFPRWRGESHMVQLSLCSHQEVK